MRNGLLLRRTVAVLPVLVAFAVFPVSSLDVGANIDGQSTLEDDTPSFRNGFSLYLERNPVVSTSEPTLRWLAEASVTAITEQNDADELETEFVPDVDVFRLEMVFPQLLGETTSARSVLGRTSYSDRPGLVFSDRIDGTQLELDFPGASVRVAAGYTGLIAGRNSGVVVSVDDSLDRSDSDVYSGSQRIVTGAELRARELAAAQSLVVGALAQFDARGEGEYEEQKIDSQYGYLQFDGPVTSDLYYELGGATSFAQRTEVNAEDNGAALVVGAAGRLQTRAYLGENEHSVITALAHYASGADTIGEYIPVTAPDVDILSGVPRNDLALAQLDYAYRPFAGEPGAKARSLEVSAYTAVDYPADFVADGPFRGLESGARVTFRPFSDFGARLVTAGYIPGDNLEEPRFLGRLQLSTSF
ncbi:MAG: hypothetical protein ACLFM0_09800 [Spirochaetales bacterium]